MSDPRVSVVVTTCNRCELAQRAVRSVLNQNYARFDVHIVDDASEDNSQQELKAMAAANDRISYWRHETRRGLSAARNTGIAKSAGDYLAFLDDDDEWKPECIEKRIGLLKRLTPAQYDHLGVIYCGCETHVVAEKRVVHNRPRIEGSIREAICTRGLSTIPSSCLFPRTVLERIGGYDENLISFVDHDSWMNLAEHGYHAYAVREPLVITYEIMGRESMVTDVNRRIEGMELHLTKWKPVLEDWLGKKATGAYARDYRTRGLGHLAGRRLREGDGRGAWCIVRHIAGRNRWALANTAQLIPLVGRSVLRMCIPSCVIGMAKRDLENVPFASKPALPANGETERQG